VFDVYGTLLDVHGVQTQLEARFPGKGEAISTKWREKQIEYSRLRSMSDRYVDFWQITGDALDHACEFAEAPLDADARVSLLAVYERLPAHPEVPAALRALAARGLTLGVLSNGDKSMVDAALDAAGLRPLFEHVLSVERVRIFRRRRKPTSSAPTHSNARRASCCSSPPTAGTSSAPSGSVMPAIGSTARTRRPSASIRPRTRQAER
jgi:2-haloalkanoic acid dehalogenase type II